MGEGCGIAARRRAGARQARIRDRAARACHGQGRHRGQGAAGRRAESPLRRRRRPARRADIRRRHRLYRLCRYSGVRARPCQRGGEERAGEHRGRQHQRGGAGAGRLAGERGFRCFRARGRARDDGEGRPEMHRHPPHLRAGWARPMRSRMRLQRSSRAPRSAIRARPTPAWGRWSRAASRPPPSKASGGWRPKRRSFAAARKRPLSTASMGNESAFVAPTLLRATMRAPPSRPRGRGFRSGRHHLALSR